MLRHRLAALASALVVTSLAACGGGASAPAASCTDGARNGEETAVDCGGPACSPCPAGQACASARDCLSGVCTAGASCAAPTCADGVRNGRETGLDCGGECPPCADGLACQVDGDCASGRCQGQACLKALGAACASGPECASATCADSVCCEAACAGTCEACNLPGRFGHCDPVPDGEDPAGECAAGPATGCGLDGACSGSRSCRLYAAGTPCTAPSCTPDLSAAVPISACDGAGLCAAPSPATIACAPLTCDPAGGACRTRCADASQCAAGHGCAPSGGCLLLDGQGCGTDAECLGGRCVDGVCCESACGGACEACNLPGRAGFCDAIPAGQDPAEECAATGAATCGTSGACSGSRTCALWAGATVCAPAGCDSLTVSRPASLCSGAGACQSQGTVDCAPLACDSATGLCRTTCGSEVDCAPGHVCTGGTCRKAAGVACAVGGECASGHCTDGVCCESACAGTCERCDQAGRLGFCDAIPAGTDPAGECADQGAASCGTSGVCSGARSCARYAFGTVCAAASCAGATTSAPADACDGLGSCVDAGIISCSPFTCNSATGGCRSTCTVSGECAPGYTCTGGACKAVGGQPCTSGAQCGSGQCADGVCCNTPCGGVCQACNQVGNVGTCILLASGSDPDGECPADGCHPGVCNGSGACTVSPAGTICAAGKTCDAAGNCL